MPYEKARVRTTYKNYGEVKTGGGAGVDRSTDSKHLVKVDVTTDIIAQGYLTELYIPAGALMTAAYANVTEAFVLEGTTPAIAVRDVDTVGNFVTLDEADAEAAGHYDITANLAGEWGTAGGGQTAAAKIEVVLTGTTPSITGTAGRVEIVLEYIKSSAQ
jgi:hypothetical protein